MKGDRLGEFEELTLLAIRAVEPPAYAVPVQRFIATTTGRDVVMGAVYAASNGSSRKASCDRRWASRRPSEAASESACSPSHQPACVC